MAEKSDTVQRDAGVWEATAEAYRIICPNCGKVLYISGTGVRRQDYEERCE